MASQDHSPDLVWPIERRHLAGLVGIGLSDDRIAACFSVDCLEVRLLRERYDLAKGISHGLMIPNNGASAKIALDELSNAAQAAITYASSALKYAKRDANVSATTLLLIEKSMEQLIRVGKAYRSLQGCLFRTTE